MLEIPESELVEACRDAVLINSGVPIRGEPHYLTSLFTDATDPFRRMAESICQTAHIDVDFGSRTMVLQRAITTSMFSTIGAAAGNIAARVRVNSTLSDIRPMVSEIELSDYRPIEYPILETHEIDSIGQPEGRGIPLLMVTANGETLQVEESVSNLIFSRELLINNDFDVLLRSGEAAGAAAGRALGVKLAALLADNGDLSDGAAWFVASAGNILTTGALSAAALDASASALRKIATTDGTGYTNGAPRFLIVPASTEFTAKALISSFNTGLPEDQRLRLVVLPWLADGFFYMLAAPDQAPSIAMATLSGGNGDIVSFEELPRASYRAFSGDGAGFRQRTTLGLSAVSRSVVRNTTA